MLLQTLTPTSLSKTIFHSIAVKLAVIMMTVVVGGMALLSLFILGNQNKIFEKQVHAYAAALGSQLSFAATEPLLAGDLESLKQLVGNLEKNDGIEGVAIYSDQSQLLAATGDVPDGDPALVPADEVHHWFSADKDGLELSSYVDTAAFRELIVGYCVVTFDRSFMSAAYKSTRKTILIITSCMVFLGGCVAVFLSKLLSQPVRQLVGGIREINKGNYQFRFPVDRNDELRQVQKSLNLMTEGLQKKEQVEQIFSRYVSPNVARTLMDDLEKNDLGGCHVEATVLYADIASFTELSAKLEPEAINNLLNDYFTRIDTIAGHHMGHIDKFIGDCAMILFGAPFRDEEHGLHAIQCGLEIQQVMEEYNRERVIQGKITVEFSVAVNSGKMLAGNIGSKRRMEYTVIGDAVNLAARLSSVAVAGQVLVTKYLHDDLHLDSLYETQLSGTVQLRGKTNPVEVWQISPFTEKETAPDPNHIEPTPTGK